MDKSPPNGVTSQKVFCDNDTWPHAVNQGDARQRDDRQLEAWTAEIKLRAGKRIGELIRDLDKRPGVYKPLPTGGKGTKSEGPRGKFRLPAGGKSKAEAIREAGLSKTTAARLEALAGPKEERAMKAAAVGGEHYLATAQTNGRCAARR